MRKTFLIALSLMLAGNVSAQQGVDIWALMERRDLRLTEIDAIAKRHFDQVGRVRGTGYKQYERWKYEKQFHLDANGFILPDDYDALQYKKLAGRMANGDAGLNNAVAGAWTELGPTYWSRTSGWNPGVGRITSISVYPPNPNIIYVTSPGGGVWKSTVGGNAWIPMNDYNNSMMTMYSVAVDPTNPDIVFTGSSGGVIYKSTDGGATWASKSSGMGSVKKILINPNNPLVMYATGSGIWKSIDGGNTWVKKSANSNEDIEFKPGNTNVLYASGSNVYRSLDGGETWAQLGSLNGITYSARCMIGVSAADSNVVYIVQAGGSEFGRLYRSNDGGNSFSITISGSAASCTNFFGYSTNGCGTGGQATYDMGICVNPLNANEVHIAGIICWKSTNGGTSFVAETAWSLPNTIGYNHADVHVLEFVGNTIYSGSDGGIYKSTDYGDNWTDLSRGLGVRQFYRIANSKTSKRIVTGGAQDNGTSVLRSTGWLDWLGADGMDALVSPLDSNLMWGTSQYGTLYKSTNGGSSYSNITSPASGNWVTPLAIQSNSNVIYSGYAGVYKSTDNGTTWTKISDSVITSNLSVLAVAPSNPNYIYASTGSVLYVTKDGGATWSTRTLSSITITSFAIHPTNPEKVWISSSNTTNRVLVSTDAGATFTSISSNLPASAARSVVVDNTGDEGLYAGMNIGVYYTNKNMTSWVNLTDNLPQVAINEVELQISGGKVRAATYGRGVWERDLYNPCSAPTALQSTSITDTSATLSWTGNASATGYNIEYKLTSSSTWITAASNRSGTTFVLGGLSMGTAYDWRVAAVCSGGSSSYASSSFTTIIPCGTPASLTANNLTVSSARLNWTAVNNASSYAVYYKISSSSSWILAADTITQISYTLSNLSEGTTYDWKVAATCPLGTGLTASSQFTTPITCNAPANLSTTNITATSAVLNWTAVSGASTYDIDFKLSASATWTPKATGLSTTTYSLTGLSGGTAYDWRVRSNCGSLSGYSNYSTVSFTTEYPCAAPTSPVANNLTTSGAKLNWTASPDAISYSVSYKTSSSSVWILAADTVTQSYYLLEGLSEGTTYDWKVSSICQINTSAAAVSQFTTPIVCNAPFNLATGNITVNSATLSWDAVSGASSYDVDVKLSSASTWTNKATGLNALSYSLTGLSGGTSYDWRVRTNCGTLSGNSAYSESSFTTVYPCGTPTSLVANNLTSSGAKLNWTAVAEAVTYSVSYKISTSLTWILAADTVTQPYYFLSGLNAGTTYDWKVSSICLKNTGTEASSQFTTPVVCNPPATLTTTSIATTSATLNWTAVSGAASYDVDFKLATALTWTNRATGITTLSTSLTGLTANTAYNWRVRTNCGTLSGYSSYATANFTTLAAPCTDSYETNNTSGTAKSITLGTQISAAIGTSTDIDWFRFTTPNTTASNVRVTLSNLPANYDLNLYDRNLLLIASGTNLSNASETVIFNTTVKKVTYYVRVIGVGGAFSSTQCYNLKAESSATPYTLPAPSPGIAQQMTDNQSETFIMFPVPARQQVNIIYNSRFTDRGQLIITDLAGRNLQTRLTDIRDGRNDFKMNLSGYRPGTYLIRLITKEKTITEKLIIGQ